MLINKGISFGLLSGISPWIMVVGLAMILIIAVNVRELWTRVGLGLILLGGGMNLYSRLTSGGVVDYWNFLGLFYNNLADWLIGIGIAIFIFQEFGRRS